jgi:hypothetical protein
MGADGFSDLDVRGVRLPILSFHYHFQLHYLEGMTD